MCKVTWCENEDKFFKNGNKMTYCSLHSQYKEWVSNAPTRPWLMYKLEKILNEDTQCEKCGDDLKKRFPDRSLRDIIQGMDVDHINSDIKGTLEGEQPSNYQLICKYCHLWKSIDEKDFINKKCRK